MASMIWSAVTVSPFDKCPVNPCWRFLDLREDAAADDANAAPRVLLREAVAQILVEAAQNLVAPIDQHRLRAEPCKMPANSTAM